MNIIISGLIFGSVFFTALTVMQIKDKLNEINKRQIQIEKRLEIQYKKVRR